MLEGGIAFELQRTEGDETIGPLDRARIREMLYAGELTGRERVRLPGSDGGWSLLTERAEFAEVLELLEIQSPRSQRIQGWQSQAKPASAPQPAPAPPTPPPARPVGSKRPIALIIGVVVVVVGVLAALMLQW